MWVAIPATMTNRRRSPPTLKDLNVFAEGTGTLECVSPHGGHVDVAYAISPWLIENALLRSLHSEQVRALCEIGVIESLEPGQTIYGLGDKVSSVYLVLDGQVDLLGWARRPGEMFGEFSLSTESLSLEIARAQSAVTLVAFPVAMVRRILRSSAPVPVPGSSALREQLALGGLRRSGLFGSLPAPDLASLAKHCVLRAFAVGEEIEAAGSESHVYLVLSGQLSWSQCHPYGEPLAGELVEGVAFRFAGGRASAAIRARSSGWLLQLSRMALAKLRQADPSASARLGFYL